MWFVLVHHDKTCLVATKLWNIVTAVCIFLIILCIRFLIWITKSAQIMFIIVLILAQIEWILWRIKDVVTLARFNYELLSRRFKSIVIIMRILCMASDSNILFERINHRIKHVIDWFFTRILFLWYQQSVCWARKEIFTSFRIKDHWLSTQIRA